MNSESCSTYPRSSLVCFIVHSIDYSIHLTCLTYILGCLGVPGGCPSGALGVLREGPRHVSGLPWGAVWVRAPKVT